MNTTQIPEAGNARLWLHVTAAKKHEILTLHNVIKPRYWIPRKRLRNAVICGKATKPLEVCRTGSVRLLEEVELRDLSRVSKLLRLHLAEIWSLWEWVNFLLLSFMIVSVKEEMNGSSCPHILSRHEFVSFTFHFHCLARATKVRRVSLTGRSLSYGRGKVAAHHMKPKKKLWQAALKRKSCPDGVFLFFFFSIISASSASRKIQLTWAPPFMWWSYSFCHKSGRKKFLSSEPWACFPAGSRAHHGVKRNSDVVVKLFHVPSLRFCDLRRRLRQG